MITFPYQLINWISMHPGLAGFAVFMVAFTEALAVAGLLVPGDWIWKVKEKSR